MFEQSYGIIPLRKRADGWYLLLIQHGSAKYWGFPKGHAEAGESPQEAAVRELYEETRLEVVNCLSDTPIEGQYFYFNKQKERVFKKVCFFVAEIKGRVKLQEDEVGDYKWVPFQEADKFITYDTDKKLWEKAVKVVFG